MTPDAAFALEIPVVAGLVVLIVAIVVASSGACRDPAAGAGRAAAVHDVERALGADTLVTYDQARAALKGRRASSSPSAEGKDEAPPSCALCLSEYAGGDELVRVVPACGHFFHAECGIDWWLRTRGTCPYCRAVLRPLPWPECPPMAAPRWAGSSG
ncbi:putative RING zinc finger domain superfamily protein [Panicum miliaceum]|uniref:RING-type E3 ubiquitin transferase n=1 Tax=Panicum miliaceum TaxID=4540 RepID=A0A3L6S9M1_PANMI|nr:putative RING zinc finger domain superfamily protein [Panicum miliaceum]